MRVIDSLKEFSPEHYVLVVVCFLAMFSPGLLMLGIYYPDQFMAMTSLKLVLLSFALGLPLAAPHIVGVALLFSLTNYSAEEKLKIIPALATMLGAIIATGVSYFLIAVSFLLGLKVKVFVFSVFSVEFAICCLWVIAFKKMRKSRAAPNMPPNSDAVDGSR